MSVSEMDKTAKNSSCLSDQMKTLKSDRSEPTNFRNSFHSVRLLEVLQSLRKYVLSIFRCLKIHFYNKFLFLEMKFYVILA